MLCFATNNDSVLIIKARKMQSINLSKHETINLTKSTDTNNLDSVTFCLGWENADKPKKSGLFGMFSSLTSGDDVDLDASALLIDANGKLVGECWFQRLTSKCGSLVHSGDIRTGRGQPGADKEKIIFNKSKMPTGVKTIAFTVNSWTGHTFNDVKNPFVRVLDKQNKELCRYDLKELGPYTGVIIGKLDVSSELAFTGLGDVAEGRSFQQMMPSILNSIGM
jgi:tellurium resistance protein TerZ